MSSQVWKEQKRHYFVLTEAGKPVYSRHGNEDKLSAVMGVMLAMLINMFSPHIAHVHI